MVEKSRHRPEKGHQKLRRVTEVPRHAPPAGRQQKRLPFLAVLPPLGSSVFESTAIPCVQRFGLNTVWAKISWLVPPPLS